MTIMTSMTVGHWLGVLSIAFGSTDATVPDAPGEATRAFLESMQEAEAKPDLPPLEVPGQPYRTPRAGEGFQTDVLGEHIRVEPRDRRSVSAWDVGIDGLIPGNSGADVLPFGTVYLWRRPDDDTLFRGILLGIYDEAIFAYSPASWGKLETVFTFENL